MLAKNKFTIFSPTSVDITLTPISRTPGIHIVSYVQEWLHFYISKPFWNKKATISLDQTKFLQTRMCIYIYIYDLADFIEQLYVAEKMA